MATDIYTQVFDYAFDFYGVSETEAHRVAYAVSNERGLYGWSEIDVRVQELLGA